MNILTHNVDNQKFNAFETFCRGFDSYFNVSKKQNFIIGKGSIIGLLMLSAVPVFIHHVSLNERVLNYILLEAL